MVLAFYCLASLDIMGLLESSTREDERSAWQDWIWKQQIGTHTYTVFQFSALFPPHVDRKATRWGTGFRSGPATALPRSDGDNDVSNALVLCDYREI